MLVNPYFISCFIAATLAALSWITALTGLKLSRAYPPMSLNFVAVLLFGAAIFQEQVTPRKIAGAALVVTGVIVSSAF